MLGHLSVHLMDPELLKELPADVVLILKKAILWSLNSSLLRRFLRHGVEIASVTEILSTSYLPRQEGMRLILFGTCLHYVIVAMCSFPW